jgi:hypothetical protein
MDADARCRLIAAHLSAVTRAYPIAVDYIPFDEHDRLHLDHEARDAPSEFAWIHRAGDPTLGAEMGVGLRAGLAEAEVVRFLVIVAFRAWLGANDNDGLIDRYWSRRRTRIAALRALRELETNIQHVHAWAARGLHARPPEADFAPVAGLLDAAFRALAADRTAADRFAGLTEQTVDAYLALVDQLNRTIFEMNQRVEDPDFDLRNKADAEEQLFTDLLADEQTQRLLDQIQALYRQINRSLSAAL